MAKVSIGIPAYNNEEGIARLLKSIGIQEFTDYEIVITDDSEDDRIYKLVEGRSDIRYFKNAKRLGATGNWNEAMGKCNGDYLKIMHHDDWFTTEDSLGKFVEMLDTHPESDMVFSGTRQVEPDRSYERFIAPENAKLIRQDYRNLFLGNTIGAPSAVMYRRNAGQYDEKLTWLVDMEFYMHILKENPHFHYTEEPLVSIGISGTQLTESCIGDKKINIEEYGYIYKKYDLYGEEKYREKLIQVLIDNEASYEKAAAFGVTEKEYRIKKAEKLVSKVKWKLRIGR